MKKSIFNMVTMVLSALMSICLVCGGYFFSKVIITGPQFDNLKRQITLCVNEYDARTEEEIQTLNIQELEAFINSEEELREVNTVWGNTTIVRKGLEINAKLTYNNILGNIINTIIAAVFMTIGVLCIHCVEKKSK